MEFIDEKCSFGHNNSLLNVWSLQSKKFADKVQKDFIGIQVSEQLGLESICCILKF
jgi:hypothetical protein